MAVKVESKGICLTIFLTTEMLTKYLELRMKNFRTILLIKNKCGRVGPQSHVGCEEKAM